MLGVFDPKRIQRSKSLSYLYIVFVDCSIIQLFVGFSVTFQLDRHSQSLAEQLDTVCHFFIYGVVSVLLVYFQWRAGSCFELLDDLNRLFDERSAAGGPTFVSMADLVTFIRRATYAYPLVGVIVNLIVLIVPAVIQRRLPFLCWYPFSVDVNTTKLLMCFYGKFMQIVFCSELLRSNWCSSTKFWVKQCSDVPTACA